VSVSAAFDADPSIGPRAAADCVMIVTRPAEVVAPELAVGALGAGAACVWDADEAGSRVAFVGGGVVARVEGRGERRIEEVRARAARLFEGLAERRAAGAEGAPAPRLFGGMAFAPSAARVAPWSGFADASFVLPRVQYATDGARAFVRVAGAASQRVDALEAEATAVAQAVERAGRLRGDAREAPSGGTCVADEAGFLALCEDLVGRIRAGELAKVALSLRAHVDLARPFDLAVVLARLARAYPACARFAFEREGRVFVGASPERLVTVVDRRVEADALAGSTARAADPADDAARARALLASPKERAEHELVVRALREGLGRCARSVDAPSTPVVRSLQNVHHLFTPVTAERAPGAHVLDVVAALHPTPAVGGAPREAALAWLARNERHDRGWYTGAVGWLDAAGDGAFSVGIRAAVCGAGHADLYAGAGIVEGSVPAQELAEVRLKLRPMLAALGVEG
jgi:isochorismate synthase